MANQRHAGLTQEVGPPVGIQAEHGKSGIEKREQRGNTDAFWQALDCVPARGVRREERGFSTTVGASWQALFYALDSIRSQSAQNSRVCFGSGIISNKVAVAVGSPRASKSSGVRIATCRIPHSVEKPVKSVLCGLIIHSAA